jgi:hypothetical protein
MDWTAAKVMPLAHLKAEQVLALPRDKPKRGKEVPNSELQLGDP